MLSPRHARAAFTLIELLVVIAIIAILAVVVVLTLNPAELLRQSRDANRVSDMATLASALNLYTTDQSSAPTFSLGNASDTYISIYDTSATSTLGDQCQALNLASLSTSTGQAYQCAPSSTYRNLLTGWIPVNFSNLTSGSPIGNLPVDPINQTSTGLYYAYNTNGSQFEVTSELESSKYKSTYANSPQTPSFPEVISGGTQGVSALYNNSGLVGYWPLNEGSGSSTIDASGDNDAGTWGGTASGTNSTYYTSGKVGTYAGYFNGSNDYVMMMGNPATLQVANLSVVAWVNPNALTPFEDIVANYDAGAVNIGAFMLRCNNNGGVCNGLTFYIENAVANVSSPIGSFATTGAWYQVVTTYNGAKMVLYLNGVQVGTTNASATLTYNSTIPWLIGASGSTTAQAAIWNGSIDDVRIYNRALSPAEVMALYTAQK